MRERKSLEGSTLEVLRHHLLFQLDLGLTPLAARKPTSFIYCDIAEAAWDLEDYDRARKHALLALQSPGEIGYKLAALLLLARILWHDGNIDEARRHLALYMEYARNAVGTLVGRFLSPRLNGAWSPMVVIAALFWRC